MSDKKWVMLVRTKDDTCYVRGYTVDDEIDLAKECATVIAERMLSVLDPQVKVVQCVAMRVEETVDVLAMTRRGETRTPE